MMVVAMDLVKRGVNSGAGKEDAPAEQPQQQTPTLRGVARGGRGRARGRGGRSARVFTASAGAGSEEPGDGPTAEATESGTQHQPTAIELTCDQTDLQAIRDKFGSRAQTIINTALAFDAYLRWYYPYKTAVPFMCDLRRREERALDNMRST